MISRALKRITRSGMAVATQAAGAGAVVVSVGLLTNLAWAVLAAGVALLAGGALAEATG